MTVCPYLIHTLHPAWDQRSVELTLCTQPPALDIELQRSSFGLAVMYDRLRLETNRSYASLFTVNPAIILALVEGVLGYEKVSANGTIWTYRRETELRPL